MRDLKKYWPNGKGPTHEKSLSFLVETMLLTLKPADTETSEAKRDKRTLMTRFSTWQWICFSTLIVVSMPVRNIHTEEITRCPSQFTPIRTGYGADSLQTVLIEPLKQRKSAYRKTWCIRPQNMSGPLPVIFFLHGVGKEDLRSYEKLVSHIASRGFCVLFIAYRLRSFPFQRRTYRHLFKRCISAVDDFSADIDTTKVGFIGHSFGASATPYLARRMMIERAWGTAGVFMYLMAPHYVFEIDQKELENFPDKVSMIVQVYEDDDCNDHRMAKDLFETIGIPLSRKEFIVLRSDTNPHDSCALIADHATPMTYYRDTLQQDLLDFYGVYRYCDALADYAFYGTAGAQEIAFGHGTAAQRFMGTWPDGTPVREALISTQAPLLQPRSFSYFHWKHPWNLRRRRNDLVMPDSATWDK